MCTHRFMTFLTIIVEPQKVVPYYYFLLLWPNRERLSCILGIVLFAIPVNSATFSYVIKLVGGNKTVLSPLQEIFFFFFPEKPYFLYLPQVSQSINFIN